MAALAESRFERFLRAFNAKLEATDDGATWFYHEPALYHIIGLLVTDEFEERLHREVRKARYGTPEWVYFRRELLDTIEGSPLIRGTIDWTAARERAEDTSRSTGRSCLPRRPSRIMKSGCSAMNRANPAGAVDAPIARLFAFDCQGRRATDQQRSATAP